MLDLSIFSWADFCGGQDFNSVCIFKILLVFNIQSDIPQNVYKYEWMIAGYYRSRI